MAPVAGFRERKEEYLLNCKRKNGRKVVRRGRCGGDVCIRGYLRGGELDGLGEGRRRRRVG
jgi:hypothetical protein